MHGVVANNGWWQPAVHVVAGRCGRLHGTGPAHARGRVRAAAGERSGQPRHSVHALPRRRQLACSLHTAPRDRPTLPTRAANYPDIDTPNTQTFRDPIKLSEHFPEPCTFRCERRFLLWIACEVIIFYECCGDHDLDSKVRNSITCKKSSMESANEKKILCDVVLESNLHSNETS